jgi:hypothetical protein
VTRRPHHPGTGHGAAGSGIDAGLRDNFWRQFAIVRDFDSRRASGMIPGAAAVSHGELLYKADQEVPQEWRDARLQDRSRPIVTHCDLGPLGAISAQTLQDSPPAADRDLPLVVASGLTR